MSEIVIYQAKDGQVELRVNLSEETVWLTQKQMADLFQKDVRTINEHILNVFDEKELVEKSTIRKFRIVQMEGQREVAREVVHYNLDAVISVGYRVKSPEGTQFRIWATQLLKEHLIRGYTLNNKRLAERGVKELQQSIELLQRTLTNNALVSDVGIETIQLIMSYARTWHLLLGYDEDTLLLPKEGRASLTVLEYDTAIKAILTLKNDLMAKSEASALFGNERESGLKSILGNLEQTFGGEELYKSSEEKAGHLFYFVIKDHPFSDGNKRIGCLLFLLYLKQQNIVIKLNDNGLVALALLVAESDPTQKDLMVRLIVNLLVG